MTFTGQFVETTTDDGLCLQGLFAEADTETVVVHFHGMSGNLFENQFVQTMLSDYPENDISFLTVEQRGSELMRWFDTVDGDSRKIGNAHEQFEDAEYDIKAWIDFLDDAGYETIIVQGHSLAPSKITYYMSETDDDRIDGLVFISPSEMQGLVVHESTPEHEDLLAEARRHVEDGNEDQLLSDELWGWAVLSAGTYLNFFGDDAQTDIFTYSQPENDFSAVDAIDVPLIAFLGTEDDGIVTPPEACLSMLEEAAEACPAFEGIVFDGADHSYAGFGNSIVSEVRTFFEASLDI
ncbi:MAG: DUF1749 domain-containing protein [Candidatus Nanohaloarchaeota archaeon QJJ-5]|nr:DUF1749 domain-containing protein [Candidatus Nanohaloarchaeota archaeon QJJ-5]